MADIWCQKWDLLVKYICFEPLSGRAIENWQGLLECIIVLQLEAKSKPGRGKAATCAVLGAVLAAAMEERAVYGS